VRRQPKYYKERQWLRGLIVDLSLRKPGFDPRSVHVRFMVDKVALRYLPVFRFSPVSIVLPILHTLVPPEGSMGQDWKRSQRN